MPEQLSLAGTAVSGNDALVISGTREIEPGARTMVLLAENLFRLDVALVGDALRTVVRNLSQGELTIGDGDHAEAQPHIVFGDAAHYQPAQGRVRFWLGAGRDRICVSAIIGILRFAQRGTVRVTAQAVIRRAPEG